MLMIAGLIVLGTPDAGITPRQEARAAASSGDRAKAISILEKAVAAQPNDIGARLDLASLLRDAGRAKDSAAQFLEAGATREREGYVLQAVTIYRTGAETFPESKPLAAAYARLQKRIESGIDDGSIVSDSPRSAQAKASAEAMLREAEVYVKHGLNQKAIARLQELLSLNPDYAPAKKRLAELQNTAP
jgi:tetratricopeptide (TPR) repeat protein